MNWFRRLVAFAGCLVLPWLPVAADDAAPANADEQILRTAEVAADGPALLEFFRRRTVSDVERTRIQGLIRLLGDPSFPVRERASRDLTAGGPPAPALL